MTTFGAGPLGHVTAIDRQRWAQLEAMGLYCLVGLCTSGGRHEVGGVHRSYVDSFISNYILLACYYRFYRARQLVLPDFHAPVTYHMFNCARAHLEQCTRCSVKAPTTDQLLWAKMLSSSFSRSRSLSLSNLTISTRERCNSGYPQANLTGKVGRNGTIRECKRSSRSISIISPQPMHSHPLSFSSKKKPPPYTWLVF